MICHNCYYVFMTAAFPAGAEQHSCRYSHEEILLGSGFKAYGVVVSNILTPARQALRRSYTVAQFSPEVCSGTNVSNQKAARVRYAPSTTSHTLCQQFFIAVCRAGHLQLRVSCSKATSSARVPAHPPYPSDKMNPQSVLFH